MNTNEPSTQPRPSGLAATFLAMASGDQTEQALKDRRTKILEKIKSSGLPPTELQMRELSSIGIALGEG